RSVRVRVVAGFAEEFPHRVVDLGRVRIHVAGAERGREVDLVHFGAAHPVEEVEQGDSSGPSSMSELVYSVSVLTRPWSSFSRPAGEIWWRAWLRKLCWRAERTMSGSGWRESADSSAFTPQ